MKYRLLGPSGLRVSELCLGTMTFGEELGWGSSKEESRKVFETFVEAGGNFLDTADLYTYGTSEKMVGEFAGPERDRFVIATKYTLSRREGDPNGGGNHRKSFFQALHASLKRLNTDYIDLYWLHAWDHLTPVEEVMRAFDDAVRAGKILYAGISNAPAWIVAQANTLATLRGWTPFVGLQIEYSLIERTVERDLVPMARALGLGVTAWSPLAGGLLTGKYAQISVSDEPRRLEKVPYNRLTERNLAVAQAVTEVAKILGKSPAQVALAWLRQQGKVIPIVGARKAEQLRNNLEYLSLTIPPEWIEKLDVASKIELGFPHEFLTRPYMQDLVFSKVQDQIECG